MPFLPGLLLSLLAPSDLRAQDDQPLHAPVEFSGPSDCDPLPLLKFGIISDPQYCNMDPEGTRYFRESLAKLSAALEAMNQEGVDFVIELGDLIDNDLPSYDAVLPLFKKLAYPSYKLFGNHEFAAIPESSKPTLVSLLGMPSRYYDFSCKNWHFLVLDGSEMASYSMALHPELKPEADSMEARVQGRINSSYANGGIGRVQLRWIRAKLTAWAEHDEPVIVFNHYPVYPFNHAKNLWNDSAVVHLLDEFPNVVAYINGHNHYGNYGWRHGIHYLTHNAMVETRENNSYSILSVYPDRIEIDGRGLNPDRTWTYRVGEPPPRLISLSDKLIRSRDTAGSYIGTFHLLSPEGTEEKASFLLDPDTLDGLLFRLSDHSLFLNTNEDLSGRDHYRIAMHSMNCARRVYYETVILDFDGITIGQKHPIRDTVIDVKDEILTLLPDDFFRDDSRLGLTFEIETGNPDIASVSTEPGKLICKPNHLGKTMIYLTAEDRFTHFRVSDSFLLEVKRLYNKPPTCIHPLDSVTLQVYWDTLTVFPDTLFADPDGDELTFALQASHPQVVSIKPESGAYTLIPLQSGESEVSVTATDQYGGTEQLIVHLTVTFDSITIHILRPLPDTLLDVKQARLALSFKDRFIDESVKGLTYAIRAKDPEIAEVMLAADTLVCRPHRIGKTWVYFTIRDTFVHFEVTDTFLLQVKKLFNLPPLVVQQLDSVFLRLGQDTLQLYPDTLFMDPDGDSLRYSLSIPDPQVLKRILTPGRITLIPLKPGGSEVRIKASDGYLGQGDMAFYVTVEMPSSVLPGDPSRLDFRIYTDSRNRTVVIESGRAHTAVQIMISDLYGRCLEVLHEGPLQQGMNYFPWGISNPDGLYLVTIRIDHQVVLTCKLLFTN